MKKIVIVEDEATTLKILSKVVSSLGFSPILCSNGRLAWEVIQDNPDISLIITDIIMPEMSGADLIQNIQTMSNLKNIPVIITSGFVTLKEINHILKLGAFRFIPKPVDIVMLKEYIEASVNGQVEPQMHNAT